MKISNQPTPPRNIHKIVNEAIQEGHVSRCDCEECNSIFSNWPVPHTSLILVTKLATAIRANVLQANGLTGVVSVVHNNSVIVGINYQYVDLEEVAHAEKIRDAIWQAFDYFYDCETDSGQEYLPLDQAA